jgi:hypothetical protein
VEGLSLGVTWPWSDQALSESLRKEATGMWSLADWHSTNRLCGQLLTLSRD